MIGIEKKFTTYLAKPILLLHDIQGMVMSQRFQSFNPLPQEIDQAMNK